MFYSHISYKAHDVSQVAELKIVLLALKVHYGNVSVRSADVFLNGLLMLQHTNDLKTWQQDLTANTALKIF